jgi:hypothetical protein
MVRDATLELVLISVHTTPAAKSVSDVQRVIHVEDDGDQAVLKYGVAMAAVGEPLTHHLRADLIRQPLV